MTAQDDDGPRSGLWHRATRKWCPERVPSHASCSVRSVPRDNSRQRGGNGVSINNPEEKALRFLYERSVGSPAPGYENETDEESCERRIRIINCALQTPSMPSDDAVIHVPVDPELAMVERCDGRGGAGSEVR